MRIGVARRGLEVFRDPGKGNCTVRGSEYYSDTPGCQLWKKEEFLQTINAALHRSVSKEASLPPSGCLHQPLGF